MNVAVVLNGDPPSRELLLRVAEISTVYAADGGAKACLDAAVSPVKVVGDFDSLSRDALPQDWNCEQDADQDTTDFEKILSHLPSELTTLTILGGLGGRLDHTWNNLVVSAGLPSTLPVRFLSDAESLWRITPDCSLQLNTEEGKTVSVLPMGLVKGVYTEGLQWELDDAELGPGKGLAQSNLARGTVRVSVREGTIFFRLSGHMIE